MGRGISLREDCSRSGIRGINLHHELEGRTVLEEALENLMYMDAVFFGGAGENEDVIDRVVGLLRVERQRADSGNGNEDSIRDIVICSESREQLEEQLERWRHALERRGMKISRSKTEYMCMNERGGGGRMRLQGEEMARVEDFKYLGSTVQSNGECGQEVKKRVQAGWNGWRKVSGVLCDRRVSARMKGKVYKTVVRPAMMYGLETVALKTKQEAELEVAEMKMLRFALGVTRLDKIR
ncbi:uncharacterized protein LOC133474503, partial [Phyllopteryx taeniolatus]|uniref:uncharacterized protein LOC133474503 n=1 Tax=Phyllopteryx taeniolatus TaxID=161469 RepID=UPI002AD3D4DF